MEKSDRRNDLSSDLSSSFTGVSADPWGLERTFEASRSNLDIMLIKELVFRPIFHEEANGLIPEALRASYVILLIKELVLRPIFYEEANRLIPEALRALPMRKKVASS